MIGIQFAYILVISIVVTSSSELDKSNKLITRGYIEDLKTKINFETYTYDNHPFKDMSLSQIKKKLGLNLTITKREVVYGNSDDKDLPVEFDSRRQWEGCIHPIRDQGDCGSCWAFAASGVLSDRYCIASKGKVNVVLSPQDLVSCDDTDLGCGGGTIDDSWMYLTYTGIATEKCYPYESADGDSRKCKTTCKDGSEILKYSAKNNWGLRTITDAKKSLIEYGPVETGFSVYEDFISYSSGVYRYATGQYLGGHAVKIIGWGIDEDGSEHWIVANSWGASWGEEGYFRIGFGECNFEDDLWAGQAEYNELFLE